MILEKVVKVVGASSVHSEVLRDFFRSSCNAHTNPCSADMHRTGITKESMPKIIRPKKGQNAKIPGAGTVHIRKLARPICTWHKPPRIAYQKPLGPKGGNSKLLGAHTMLIQTPARPISEGKAHPRASHCESYRPEWARRRFFRGPYGADIAPRILFLLEVPHN